MLKKLKDIYNKSTYDYSEGYVDPFEYHKTFYFWLKIFGVVEGNNIKHGYLKHNALVFTTGFACVIFAIISFCRGLYFFEIPMITEGGTYVIVLMYQLLILSCTETNLPQFKSLLTSMQEDFQYICTAGQKYRKRYFDIQLQTWKASLFSIVFTYALAFGMVSFASVALVYYLITHGPEDKGSRPLLFPFWLPHVDFGKTPIYEITFMFSNISAVVYAHNYIFMIQTQIVWIRHIASKVDIVIWSIQDVLEGIRPAKNQEEKMYYAMIIKGRMREIIKHHQSMYSLMENYSEVYKKMLIFEQTFCGPVVCLTAYCTAEKLDEGEVNMILILLSIGTVVLYFIPSQLCTFLRIKVSSVCNACWGIDFWNGGVVLKSYLVLIMQRSLRPLPLQVPGFQEMSIQTFSSKMTSAYSCFNMLRQANRK
ncbi:uncharacterized protein LOC115445483 [Manduca sexta]|uniref:uncharacterized protein LOC115445483 n=1 Tax=Manduca sexta TaxID=7130 RepID=UPI00188EAF47|nr:uncharacterized protein LOC115445483 [Manduca sexta]